MATVMCRACKNYFEASDGGSHYCRKCEEEDRNFFQPIREYLLVNPKTSAFVIMDMFKITPARLKRYLKEGWLVIAEEENSFLKCEACNKPINTGRFCNKCVNILQRELKRKITNCTYVDREEIKGKVNAIIFKQILDPNS